MVHWCIGAWCIGAWSVDADARSALCRHPHDTQVRVCFVRKNKTLRSGFRSKAVMKLLEKNYQIFCSSSNPPIVNGPDFDFKSYVMEVLEQSEYADKRARMMDGDDFLALLHAFNAANIHFQ